MPSARVRLPLMILSLSAGVSLTSACKEPAAETATTTTTTTTASEVVQLEVKPNSTPTLASVLDA